MSIRNGLFAFILVLATAGCGTDDTQKFGPSPDDGGGQQSSDVGGDADAGDDESDASHDAGCTPKTCAEAGAQCGTIDDGCGGELSCGLCAGSQSCSETNQCEACDPETDQSICNRASATCGELTETDNCGQPRVVTCGECKTGEVCNAANRCVDCDGETDTELCSDAGATCGEVTVTDSCGVERTVTCGTCDAGEVCEQGACVCDPLTCADVPNTCGLVDDGCGGEIVCDVGCVEALGLGGNHTCVVDSQGGMSCWGKNKDGQLGLGSNMDANAPMKLGSISGDVAKIVAGEKHTCALVDGGVQCWGDNKEDQLAASGGDATLPQAVATLGQNVTDLGVGGFHTCAIFESGTVKCWGANGWGQLGDGTTSPTDQPVDVLWPSLSTPPMVVKAEAGPLFTCLMTSMGELYCWGENTFGQVGDGMKYSDPLEPTLVQGLSFPVSDFCAGGWYGSGSGVGPSITGFTCAVDSNGAAKCWGANIHGQLGDGTAYGFGSHSMTPVQVVGLASDVESLACGGEHACALTTSGDVECWGYNEKGQLGDGTTTSTSTPVDVQLSEPAVAIYAGGFHTCAVLESGELSCWGKNGRGQIGDGTTTDRPTPVRVP